MRAYIQEHRTADKPFDIVTGGRVREKDTADAKELLTQHEAAGVTWWLESFWSNELTSAQSVARGGLLGTS